jgi:(2Fe-2S) ferredoxin
VSIRFQILICDGPSCGVQHESDLFKERLEQELSGDAALGERATICDYTCFGRCEEGPNMFIRRLEPGDDPDEEPDTDVLESQRGFYPGYDEAKLLRIVRQHVSTGEPVESDVDDY